MTTTPEPIKGVPRLEADPTFTLRGDYNALADWVKGEVNEPVASTAALPASGNYQGRQRFVDADDLQRVYDGSDWLVVGGRVPTAKTVLAADQAVSGAGMTVVSGLAAQILDAPSGVYDLRVFVVVDASSAGAGNLRVAAQGVALNNDQGFDFAGSGRQSVSFGDLYTHAGGTLTVDVSVLRSSGTWTVKATASRTLVHFVRSS